MVLDGWLYYQDPSLPQFSSLTYLYIAILAFSSLIAVDFSGLFRKQAENVKMADKFTSIAMIGCGSMGGGMALLFAEVGVHVGLSDPSEEAMDSLLERAEKEGYHGKLQKFKDYKALCNSLSKPRLLVFSLPHGSTGDKVLEGLMPFLSRGDFILDCGNENYKNTERRQAKSRECGINYVGCGVSGGYQAARAGPSMCPGGDEEALNEVMPLLRRVAAKDKDGKPCVDVIGRGGAGHYVKMLHNGIEHGMMGAICEAWGIMRSMGMEYEEIGRTFQKWNDGGELKGTFLIAIGADLSHKRDGTSSDDTSHPLVISQVLDKVVQDVTEEEGTGVWSNQEAVDRHIPAFTLEASHALRLASAYRGERERANATSGGGFPPQEMNIDKEVFIEDLRYATYAACLASFIQGLNVIARADEAHGWHIKYANVWKIWRAGCIIQADYISDEILAPVFNSPKTTFKDINLLFNKRTMQDVSRTYPSLRRIVAKAVDTDQVVPTLSASLEYFKVATGTNLPTSFQEAQMDYFGGHKFDKKGDEDIGGPTVGKHHFEWKPVKSQREEYGRVF